LIDYVENVSTDGSNVGLVEPFAPRVLEGLIYFEWKVRFAALQVLDPDIPNVTVSF
jgi:hypothetical protein